MSTMYEIRNEQPLEALHSSAPALAPDRWHSPVVHTECSLHQLSPYIGKLKSSIAADVIRAFSRPGDTVVDPFCGAGTVALEAALLGRASFSSDISPYAHVLTHGKLNAPASLDLAMDQIEQLLRLAESRAVPDLRSVPSWVRAYFHPKTLKEAISFAAVCRECNHSFGMACFLGILHHQRPGFLSYPSSHLVPYLRTKMFPQDQYPEMYAHRPLRARLLRKVERAYKRHPGPLSNRHRVVQSSSEMVSFPKRVNAVITSPPYMNALDYGRDNRLRLWFLDPKAAAAIDEETPDSIENFRSLMDSLAEKAGRSLVSDGYCVMIVGEATSNTATSRTAEAVVAAFVGSGNGFELVINVPDLIPDIRRSRRDCRGVKLENVIAFRKRS